MKNKLRKYDLAVIGVVLGLVMCMWLTNVWARKKVFSWRQFDLPDDTKAARFLPVSDDYLYLQSQDGRFYAFALAPPQGGWREVEPTQVGELSRQGHSNCELVVGPWNPAVHSEYAVVEGAECGYWGPSGAFIKYSFAILENGEVWRWYYESSGAGIGSLL